MTRKPGFARHNGFKPVNAEPDRLPAFEVTLPKTQLAAMLLDQLGLSERGAQDLVESFFEKISLVLEAGESVSLAGFGNFEKAENAVAFHPGEKLQVLTRDSR